jgi:putative oxidoreductase
MKKTIARLLVVDQNSRSTDIALLLVRIMVGVSLIYHHGAEKFYNWNTLVGFHLDPIGIGVGPSVAYAGFADGICALAVVFGLWTRVASFFTLICLGTVFFIMEHALSAPLLQPGHGGHGELVWLYMAGFVVTLVGGPGRFSLDNKFSEFWRSAK